MHTLSEPFDGHSAGYQQWRQQRLLAVEETTKSKQVFEIDVLSPGDDTALLENIITQVREQGFAMYQWRDGHQGLAPQQLRLTLQEFYTALGLETTDTGVIHEASSLSLLEDKGDDPQARFVPYSNRSLGWHSDGYYNHQNNEVKSFTLHCIHAASEGGGLDVMDPELLLIALHDADENLVKLLAHPEAMTIPGNVDELGHNRPDHTGAVFSVRKDGTLDTRFTTRKRNIHWRNSQTQAAMDTAIRLIETNPGWTVAIRLQPGQGIVTRNVLHRRAAFTDTTDVKRQMLRGRFLELPQLQQTTRERT